MSDCPLSQCDGSGAIRWRREELGDPVEIGGGLVVEPGTVYGTSLCACRRRLKPREGEAHWWTSRPIFSRSWSSQVHQETAEVSVTVEVPVSDDNYVVRSYGNRYYPTSVDLEVSSESLRWLWPDEARELAQALLDAADVADAQDWPDAAPCGHWAPCDCRTRPPQEGIPF